MLGLDSAIKLTKDSHSSQKINSSDTYILLTVLGCIQSLSVTYTFPMTGGCILMPNLTGATLNKIY